MFAGYGSKNVSMADFKLIVDNGDHVNPDLCTMCIWHILNKMHLMKMVGLQFIIIKI